MKENAADNIIYNVDCFEYFEQCQDKCFDVVFTSPPYNSKRFPKYTKFADNYKNYFEFIKQVIDESMRVARKYVILNLQANYYNKKDVYKIIGEYSDKIQRIVIWSKPNPAPSSLRHRLTNSYEFFLILSKDTVQCNSVFLRDIIEYPVNTSRTNGHSAVMKKEVCEFFIKEFTSPDDKVFDPFVGVGTTAVVCAENNRNFIGTEIVKEYCDYAEERVKGNGRNLSKSVDRLSQTC